MKSKVLVCSLLALAVVFASLPAMAGPHLNFGKEINAAQCTPGASNKMVLNIVFQVANDADSGFGGYWAIDNYNKHVQVFDMGGGTQFCVVVKYDGSFTSVAGPSPSGTSSVGTGVTGTMEGGYNGVINGSFTPGSKKTKGNIGTKDYGCSIDPTTHAALNCSYYSWVSDYFTGSFTYGAFWGWIYHGGNNGDWVNANSGSTGDITGN